MPELPDRPVLHLSTARTWRGGERQALLLARGLREAGVPSLFAAPPQSPLAERAAAEGFAIEPFSACCELDPLAWVRLARIISRRRAWLVHAHDAHGVMLGALAGRLTGARRVCTRRVDFPLRGGWKYRRGQDRVICISAAIRNIVRAAGVPPERLALVHSGIELSEPPPAKAIEAVREEFGFSKSSGKRLLVLNVAELTDHKGHRYLLEAWPEVLREIPQARLIICGRGELESELRAQAKELALDEDCIFAGFRSDVPTLLAACDLFVMSSHLEGLCTSVMDAMAAGKAVAATRAGGLPELVDDGRTGRLVPPRDPDALRGALVELLQDRKLRERLGAAGAEKAKREFEYRQMVAGTRAVYAELAAGL